MSAPVIVLLVIAGLLLVGYLLLRFNSVWICLIDNATRDDKHNLENKYQIPRYYKLKSNGEPDTSAKWPGWDGWYFFLIPDDESFPVKMIRCSLMTGLYGLDGIDNYEKLKQANLDSFKAVEYLTLVPTDEVINGVARRENNLSQHYLPKATDLEMTTKQLDTAIKKSGGAGSNLFGRITGEWPEYSFEFENHEAGFSCNLKYKGANICWWADIENIFTYFAAFGEIEGEIRYRTHESNEDGVSVAHEELTRIRGRGAFEHGFARKPFNYDFFWLPIRLLQKIFASWNPIQYNYQLFIGQNGWQGGFMLARGFGINFRNLGGFFINGAYTQIKSVKIEYLDDPKPDVVTTSGRPEKFYHRWIVRAETDKGRLEYTATREGPPPEITGNMMYYTFTYEGTYQGESISGSGYGEYLTM